MTEREYHTIISEVNDYEKRWNAPGGHHKFAIYMQYHCGIEIPREDAAKDAGEPVPPRVNPNRLKSGESIICPLVAKGVGKSESTIKRVVANHEKFKSFMSYKAQRKPGGGAKVQRRP